MKPLWPFAELESSKQQLVIGQVGFGCEAKRTLFGKLITALLKGHGGAWLRFAGLDRAEGYMVIEPMWKRIQAWLKSVNDERLAQLRAAPSPRKGEPSANVKPSPPSARELALIDQLKSRFEGREAIYIEIFVMRVNVSNIRCSEDEFGLLVDFEEIPTPGLGWFRPGARKPQRGTLLACQQTRFSERRWNVPGSPWNLYFDPVDIQGVVERAAGFPGTLKWFERRNNILEYLQFGGKSLSSQSENWQAVFPDAKYRRESGLASERVQFLDEMRERALQSNLYEAARCLSMVLGNWRPDNGLPHSQFSQLDRMVENARDQSEREILAHLRAKTGKDLGCDPRAWVEKYEKDSFLNLLR